MIWKVAFLRQNEIKNGCRCARIMTFLTLSLEKQRADVQI